MFNIGKKGLCFLGKAMTLITTTPSYSIAKSFPSNEKIAKASCCQKLQNGLACSFVADRYVIKQMNWTGYFYRPSHVLTSAESVRSTAMNIVCLCDADFELEESFHQMDESS